MNTAVRHPSSARAAFPTLRTYAYGAERDLAFLRPF